MLSCSGHWPPKLLVCRVFIHRTLLETFPAGSSLFEGRSLAFALAGCLLYWAGRTFLQQPVHHWHLSISNQHAV
jgi:hypothetical protein